MSNKEIDIFYFKLRDMYKDVFDYTDEQVDALNLYEEAERCYKHGLTIVLLGPDLNRKINGY